MLKNKDNIKLPLFILLCMVSAGVCVFFIGNSNLKRESKYNMEYQLISIKDEISGKLTFTRPSRIRSYNSICIVNETLRIQLPWAENWAYAHKHLVQFLQQNDSIYKPENSDTLFIFRNNKEYYFILEKRINYMTLFGN
ncbi:hypothetical protein [Proteiniphilum sp. X52]|uniref:hypothetical protein n=1 Tax=Proteiniphilum sp. X52 TaxID=2382159 RepID=UPI000F0A2B52|nr:hypothetical protein [Proteiniphilum sp. X52]RNC63804.1 hypothetical protein D7D25_14455 [Proteiniphilum sp. X52]